MKLASDTVDLLCAAFMLRAKEHDGNRLLYIKRAVEFAPIYKEVIGVSLTDEETETVLARLIELGVFARVNDRFTKGFVHVVGHVQKILTDLAEDQTSPFYFTDHLGRQWLNAALESPALLDELSDPELELVSGMAPAADRLVSLSHNSEELNDLRSQIAAADEALRGSNSTDEQVTSWIRAHIKAGVELLSGRKIVLSAVSALLLKPLVAAYEAVAEEPAKQAILAAIQAIRSFFGL